MLSGLLSIAAGFTHRFPGSDDPFQMMTRVLEECGELAQQVNHFERSGVKVMKYGEPDRAKLAKEVGDCLVSVLQVARYYGVVQEVEEALQTAQQRLTAEGHIPLNPSQPRANP